MLGPAARHHPALVVTYVTSEQFGNDLLAAVEAGLPNPEEPEDRPDRPQGLIQGLEPIPRFVPKKKDDP